MRHFSIALGLAAVLILLPALAERPKTLAAPAPRRYPDVYALIYAGTGHNLAENGKRVVKATDDILKEFPPDWRKKIRIGRLEGTAVLRIWATQGQPQDRARVINEALEKYYHSYAATSSEARQQIRERLELLCYHKRLVEMQNARDEKEKAARKQTLKSSRKNLQEMWEYYDSLPRPLEWATVKDRP